MSELALKLIEKEKRERTGKLDLGKCGLTELPKELFEMDWLEELFLCNRLADYKRGKWLESENSGLNNHFIHLNYDFSSLSKLKSIFLCDLNLKEIEFVRSLKQLEIIDFYENRISECNTLTNCHKLSSLRIGANRITDISFLGDLKNLNLLDLSNNNQISDYSILRKVTNLNLLDLSDNQISNLSFLENLNSLESLILPDNDIWEISFLRELKNLELLDLSYNNIDDISFLENLTNLKSLYLRNNRILDYSFLGELKNLNSLDLRYNQITNITFLRNLTNLVFLDLRDNEIYDISSLKKLKNLNSLDLRLNRIKDISSLKKLKNLNSLDLGSNQIESISHLGKLINLKSLDLNYNQIKDISILEELGNLNSLYLSYNQISDISNLGRMTYLNSLYLRSNQITDILPLIPLVKGGLSIGSEYENIRLGDNPIINPPIEIFKEGGEAILKYFKELETQGSVPIYEAKMLIVGKGGAGKTSLARRLVNNNADMPKVKESTKGIDILYHNFKTKEGHDFKINIWDFGGQEIYHATHQFFLTKRSFYVLVDDTKDDDADVNAPTFNFWLQTVEMAGESSPLLIVQNEKSDRSKQLNLKSMQGRFSNVLGSKATNIETCRGLDEVREAIEYHIQQLPLVGELLPKQWAAIRQALEELSQTKDYISFDEYLQICSDNKIPEEDRALHLSSYLHDLGTFLHFQDDDDLADLFILKNTWATDAVYKVLDNEGVKSKFGYFDAADLKEIWKDKRYRSKRPQLRKLMEKFQLCFQLKDKIETWLAPQLLPVETPEYDWSEEENLMLRYVYDFMPKGLLSRFFVRMNRYIPEPDRAWRSGVFLHRQNTDAFVLETYGDRQIVIRVKGAHSKEFMTIISEEFDAINKTYGEKLRVKKLIPCICSKCKTSTEPHFYNYENLKRRKELNKRTTECEISFEDVVVMGLLDGVFTERERIVAAPEDVEVTSEPVKPTGIQTIEMFLASSEELKEDRDAIRIWVDEVNDWLIEKGARLKINVWEKVSNSIDRKRKQDQYNDLVKRSEIFVSLFATKAGLFTQEEFQVAWDSFLSREITEHMFTYFKKVTVDMDEIDDRDYQSLKQWKAFLKGIEHWPSKYKTSKELTGELEKELDKILRTKGIL